MRPRLIINRRHMRAQQITHLLMNIFTRHIDYRDRDKESDLAREIADQLWCDGAQMITEGDRIAAGLAPRNTYGLTVEDLCIIEARLTMAMLTPSRPIVASAEMLEGLDVKSYEQPGNITWVTEAQLRVPWKLQVEAGFSDILPAEIISVDLYDHRRRLEVRYIAPGMEQTAIVATATGVTIRIEDMDEMRLHGNELGRIAKSRL